MPKRRIQPLIALRAVCALHRNPDDTAQVFRVIEALSGNHIERTMRRFAATGTGQRILTERVVLLDALSDVDSLSRLPADSLGRAYLQFLASEGITAAGLVEASRKGRAGAAPTIDFVRDRMRDQHDLWHVVTGFKGDLLGEAALLAFTFAQTGNPGVGLIVASAWLRGAETGVRRLIAEGFARGCRAEWLPASDWESLLPLPLDQVRRRLRIDVAPQYEPIRTREYLDAAAAQ